MPVWVSVVLGLAAGCAVVAGAIVLAVRPYLAVKPPKSRMADASERTDGTIVAGTSPLNPHDVDA